VYATVVSAQPDRRHAGAVSGIGREASTGTGNVPRQVLLISDAPAKESDLVSYLRDSSLRVAVVPDARAALFELRVRTPHLVLCVTRPDCRDRADVLQAIRSHAGACGLVVLFRGQDACCEADRVAALELGADDCIAEPFSLRELLARIRVILRRREAEPPTPSRTARPRPSRFGRWDLEHCARRLTAPNGCQIVLTRGEYALLAAFLDAPQQPLTRERLMDAISMHPDKADRSIDVRIARLRGKLASASGSTDVIRTERGIGYVLDLPVV
jgi:two-component system, OmpR family, response regulator